MKQEQIEALRVFEEDHCWTGGDIADVRRLIPQLLAEREALLGALRGCRASMAKRGDLGEGGWHDFEAAADNAAEDAIRLAES